MSDNTSNQLEITVEHSGDAATVAVIGEVDLDSSLALAETLALAGARTAPVVSLDLTGVRYMDSTGLRAILEAKHDAERAGGNLTVIAASNIVRRLIEISGVAQLLGLPASD